MSEYIGTFELQPLYDGRKSFHHKAVVERWDTAKGMIYVLRSYGTTVATVTPTSDWGVVPETYEVKVAMGLLSATTLRHVKEFFAQTDDVSAASHYLGCAMPSRTGGRLTGPYASRYAARHPPWPSCKKHPA